MDEIEQIWQAFLKEYRRLAKKYNPHIPENQTPENQEKMVELNILYQETYANYLRERNS